MDDRITICIVDDHPIFRQGLPQALETDLQLRVIAEAGDGTAALEQFRAFHPNVVVLDIELPQTDGLALARNLPAPSLRRGLCHHPGQHRPPPQKSPEPDQGPQHATRPRLTTC
jgi:CheY-like chemotaxis protein